METLNKLLELEILHYKQYSITVLELVSVFVIFLLTKFILWLIKIALNRKINLIN